MTPNRRLKQARELRGWSQAKVAEQIGTDATTVSRWERGLFSPTPYFRERLCTLFTKNAEELGLLEADHQHAETDQRVLTPRLSTTLAFQQEHGDQQIMGSPTSTIAPPAAPSWPRRGDTFGYILDSAAHDQQAHTLWEDAYVRVMRGQRAEAQQLGEASLNAFEHVGHPNAEALREWLKKNELLPPSTPPTTIPSAPLPLIPKSPKRSVKQMFRRRNIGLAFILLAIAALGLTSLSLNQSAAPSVQAGVQTSPIARTHQPTQTSIQHPATVVVAIPTSAPTARPTIGTQSPMAPAPVLSIAISPSNLTPAQCMPDSGYRCTLNITLYSNGQGNLSWQASSTSLPARFNPANGVGTSGQSFQVIVYLPSSPGQGCKLVFTVKLSSYTATASVSWQD